MRIFVTGIVASICTIYAFWLVLHGDYMNSLELIGLSVLLVNSVGVEW